MIVRNFEYLLALNRERHFARAAASCRVSQPTLSAGIKQLEEDMDVLIVRRGQRFEGFTAEGERVLAWAQQMMEDCMRLKQELHELREQGLTGHFRLGMLPATSALAGVLSAAFAGRYADLQISVKTMDTAELLQGVRKSELDVAVTHVDEAAHDGLDVYALYRERVFLFTRSELRQDAPKWTWDEAVELPLCLLRGALPQAARLQLKKASRVMETDSPAVLAAYLGTGRWSTILPQSMAGILTLATGLKAVTITAPVIETNVGFVTVKSNPLPTAVHTLMEMAHTPEMVAEIRSMLAAHHPFLVKRSRGAKPSAR
jgi:DNA-binding transcriptional LysR family regulator